MTAISGMNRFWNANYEHSFCTLHQQLIDCEKRVQKEYVSSMKALSDSMKTNTVLNDLLKKEWAFFHKEVEEVTGIEKALSEAHTIDLKIFHSPDEAKRAEGDYESFCKRLYALRSDIERVFIKTLYPFLQMLRNAETGWDPTSILATLWNSYDEWKTPYLRGKIENAYPLFP